MVLDWVHQEVRWQPEVPRALDVSPSPLPLAATVLQRIDGPLVPPHLKARDLLLLGELRPRPGSAEVTATELSDAPTVLATAQNRGLRISFAWPLLAQIGLLLSRFAWEGNPGFAGFVRRVDDLWDGVLAPWVGARALVDELVELVWQAVRHVSRAAGVRPARLGPWPVDDAGMPYTAALVASHDVDAVYADASWRGKPYEDQAGNLWFNFARWQMLERRLGVKSAFYFETPARERYTYGPSYDLEEPAVLEAAHRLKTAGWEIGPHIMDPGGDGVRAQVERFVQLTGVRPAGTRSHYLAHRWDTLDAKESAGLIYDSTWYAEQTQVRWLTGTVFPFRPASTLSGRPLELVELSSVVEDGVVTGVYGQRTARNLKEASEEAAGAVRRAVQAGGCAVLNWHQRTFALMDRYAGAPADWTPAFEAAVRAAEAATSRLWKTLPWALASWWRERSQVKLKVREGRVAVARPGEAGGRLVLLVEAEDMDRSEAAKTGARWTGSAWALLADEEQGH